MAGARRTIYTVSTHMTLGLVILCVTWSLIMWPGQFSFILFSPFHVRHIVTHIAVWQFLLLARVAFSVTAGVLIMTTDSVIIIISKPLLSIS